MFFWLQGKLCAFKMTPPLCILLHLQRNISSIFSVIDGLVVVVRYLAITISTPNQVRILFMGLWSLKSTNQECGYTRKTDSSNNGRCCQNKGKIIKEKCIQETVAFLIYNIKKSQMCDMNFNRISSRKRFGNLHTNICKNKFSSLMKLCDIMARVQNFNNRFSV